MSYDFALQKLCSHEVFFETTTLDFTGQTVKFLRPPASSLVQVFVDDTEIPRGGLISVPELAFSQVEPYTIRRNQNDLLYIKIGNDVPTFITLESGSRLKAIDIARDLQKKVGSIQFEAKNGRVFMRNKAPFIGTAFSFPDPRWTDNTSVLPTTVRSIGFFTEVGITPGRAVVGRMIVPGWDVIADEASTALDTRLVRFNEPLRHRDPFIMLNYVTNAPNCRRCGGIRIEFDYTILGNTYERVSDADLLAQELDKFLFTRIGSHFKWNWLGSGLVDRVGSKSNAGGVALNAIITTDISQAFSVYTDIKAQQDSRFPSQRVSDAEFPYSLNNIDVRIPPDDPTVAIISVEISTRSLLPISLKRLIGNPNPITLQQDPNILIRLGRQSGNRDFLLRA